MHVVHIFYLSQTYEQSNKQTVSNLSIKYKEHDIELHDSNRITQQKGMGQFETIITQVHKCRYGIWNYQVVETINKIVLQICYKYTFPSKILYTT